VIKKICRETEGKYKSDTTKTLKLILSHDHAVKSVIVLTFQAISKDLSHGDEFIATYYFL